jgi:hypothetical protein
MAVSQAPAPGGAPAGAPPSGPLRTARLLGVFAFLLYLLSGGGRIVGSDEVAMLELARAMLRGRIDVPAGATLEGRDGRHYTKNAAGQAVTALPLVAAGEAVGALSGLPEPRRTLAVRLVASLFNAWVTALLLVFFYAAARGLGARPGPALGAALLLGFATPLWVYAKSFMAEPLQALGLLVALAGSAQAAGPRGPRLAGIGVFVAVSAKASMAPLALACVAPLALGRPRRGALGPALAGFLLAGLGHLAYNVARFGNPLETGYGAQATLAAYSTPLWVGLFGLLLSPGKGVLWFAPNLVLLPAGWRALRRGPEATRRAALGILLAWVAGLLLYSTFEHWAGDGSFGPRYLVPLLPLGFLAVAVALERAGRGLARLAWALGLAGLLVQVGGVSIHFGAQMREAGDYPYKLPLDDPRFMSDSHFNPSFSPIAGHWRMLLRNLGEHLRGERPRLGGEDRPDPRLGVGPADQERLLHALDFWWLYTIYAGLPAPPVALAAALLLLATLGALGLLLRAARDEARGG